MITVTRMAGQTTMEIATIYLGIYKDNKVVCLTMSFSLPVGLSLIGERSTGF